MKIREATQKDVKTCLSFQKLDKEKFWKSKDFEKSVKDKDVIFLVAEKNKKIVGYALGSVNLVKRNEAFLQETRVDKKERLRGIGITLVNEFCKQAKKRKIKKIFAEIESEHIKFYIKRAKFKKSETGFLIMKTLK